MLNTISTKTVRNGIIFLAFCLYKEYDNHCSKFVKNFQTLFSFYHRILKKYKISESY